MAKDFIYSENKGGIELTKYIGAGGNVNIPSQIDGKPVTCIGEESFLRCKLQSVTIPNSIKTIADHAFKECELLTSVDIPDSVTSIGRNAFSQCKNLTSVTIPDSVKSIGYHAFFETIWLKNMQESNPFVIVNGILIHVNIYEGTVNIPNKVTSIGDSVFFCRPYLERVIIPNSVTEICKTAFDSSECEVEYNNNIYTNKNYNELYEAINK